jgi:hypothetical protein
MFKDVSMSQDEHFDVGAWVDHARGLGSPARRADIERHLASGCTVCTGLAEFFKKLSDAGLRLLEDKAPQEWSQKAEEIFQKELLRPIETLPVRRATPVPFHLSAEPAQVRADSPLGRHMTYQTPECTVDLKLEEGANPLELLLVGQITDIRKPAAAVSFTPVFVLTNNKLVASTSSNAFGEFELALVRRRNMVLSFPLEGVRIDVMLDDLMQES